MTPLALPPPVLTRKERQHLCWFKAAYWIEARLDIPAGAGRGLVFLRWLVQADRHPEFL